MTRIAPQWRRARRRRLALVALVTVVLAAGVPIAWASHAFTDVPTGSPHHDDIAAIQYAGITAGCSPGLYCPDQAVRRDQMASFLRRGYSRTAFGKRGPNAALILPGTPSEVEIASLTIAVGGAPGRTQTVKLDAVLTGLVATSSGCPCVSEFFVSRDGAGAVSDLHTITNIGAPIGGLGGETGAITAVVSVPTGTTQTFRLLARRTPGGFTGTVAAYGAISAITAAFGSTGGE